MTTAAQRISVAVPGGAYDVAIGPGLLDSVGDVVRESTGASACALVTDETVGPLFAARVEASLRAAGVEPVSLWVPAGEASKSWAEAGRLLEFFSEAGLGRDSAVVSLGGGVVGDLAGFAAATYLRGVPVVQVPTTLLAQVDSAIGGKTGVDLPRGKNLAGAFWQPAAVVADTETLETLPERQWRSGLAEVAKSAVLAGADEFSTLEIDSFELAHREDVEVEAAVRMAAGFKARIVSGDEREAADREALNYGHTFAHALERELGYGNVTHGAAVAEGMRFAAHLAAEVAGADPAWVTRQEKLLDRLGLERAGGECEPVALLGAMRSDKKARAGQVRFVLSTAPGVWSVRAVDDDVLAGALARWCASTSEGEWR